MNSGRTSLAGCLAPHWEVNLTRRPEGWQLTSAFLWPPLEDTRMDPKH